MSKAPLHKTVDFDFLKIWEKIQIVIGDGPDAGLYEARIEDMLNGGVVITNPQFMSGKTLLRNDVPVRVLITREDAAYQFQSRVKVQQSGDNKRVLLAPPRRIQRVQRRFFARVEIVSVVSYAVVKKAQDWTDWQESFLWQESYVIDISGGGVLIKLTEELPPNTILVMKMDMFQKAHLPGFVLGERRRVFRKGNDIFCGVQFILKDDLHRYFDATKLKRIPSELKRFDSKAQDQLVTYLFQKQIEFRQKGLL